MMSVVSEVGFAQAASFQANPSQAFAELNRKIGLADADAVILFVSAEYDLAGLAEILRTQVGAPVLCCTTAGEISSALGYTNGGIAAATITGCRAKLLSIKNVSQGVDSVDKVLPDACQYVAGLNPEQATIGLLVVDGLCLGEETVISRLQEAMPTVPIVGGSAGDAGKFKKTLVYADGRFQSDTATLLLLSGDFEATVFQTHHFVSSGIRLVATETDVAERHLVKLDSIPAAVRMAQVLGIPVRDITTERLATWPLMVKFGETLFVRSVKAVHADGSLSMLCAIHPGEILHVGTAGEITDTTGSSFESLRHRQCTPDLVVGFDCVLRRTELGLRGRTSEMNHIVSKLPFVGFSTFGEQYDGQHVNQTMTGVALWKK